MGQQMLANLMVADLICTQSICPSDDQAGSPNVRKDTSARMFVVL